MGGKIKEPGKIPTSGGWIYNGETLGAFCFSQEWFSGDNYEYYYDEFLNNVDSKGEFFNNPGQFFGDTIPLSSKYVSPFPLLSDYPWTGDLPVELSLCQKVITTSNVSIDDDGTATECDEDTDSCLKTYYDLYMNIPVQFCDKIAPHISDNCIELGLVRLIGETGGSMGNYITESIYGIIKDPITNKMFMTPLVNFGSLNEALNFVDDLKK
jgi:hypothetical protein